jgi:hypothetical protein
MTQVQIEALSASDLAVRLAETNEELGRAEDEGLHLHAETLRLRQTKLTTEVQRRKDDER